MPHSTWPGRTHVPPREQPPPETQRKRLTVPGLAFRAALSPRLRSPPRFIMTDSPCPVGPPPQTPLHPRAAGGVARPSCLPASQLAPPAPSRPPLATLAWLRRLFLVLGSPAKGRAGCGGCPRPSHLRPVGLSQPSRRALEDPQPAELLVLPPLCSGDMPTGQKGRKKGRQGQEEAGPAEPRVAHQDKGIRAGREAAGRRGEGDVLFHQF